MASPAVVTRAQRNMETAPAARGADPTPADAFFVRDHFDEPELDPLTYHLRIVASDACIGSLSLADLRRLPQRSLTCVVECAGNGRNRMVPRPEGVPWGEGAVGCATWEGPALRDVLAFVPAEEGAVEVLFSGADAGVEGGAVRAFERSLPLDVATGEGPILALRMNGRPLTRSHGAPVRLIVPGWYGVASVKWLAEIRYLDHPFAGFFQARRYVWDNGRPVREMRPRAVLVHPRPGDRVRSGFQRLEGRAWAGTGVAEVEVQVDDGPWQPARLAPAKGPWAWVPWYFDTFLAEGARQVRVRAWDPEGRTQPFEPVANRLGYGCNTVDTVELDVERGSQIAIGSALWTTMTRLASSWVRPQPGARRPGGLIRQRKRPA